MTAPLEDKACKISKEKERKARLKKLEGKDVEEVSSDDATISEVATGDKTCFCVTKEAEDDGSTTVYILECKGETIVQHWDLANQGKIEGPFKPTSKQYQEVMSALPKGKKAGSLAEAKTMAAECYKKCNGAPEVASKAAGKRGIVEKATVESKFRGLLPTEIAGNEEATISKAEATKLKAVLPLLNKLGGQKSKLAVSRRFWAEQAAKNIGYLVSECEKSKK